MTQEFSLSPAITTCQRLPTTPSRCSSSWTHLGRHYSPAYQWRGSTQRGPCRNKEAGEEASASPRPCWDEPPTGDTESSATPLMSSWSPRSICLSVFGSTLQQQDMKWATCQFFRCWRWREWRCEIGVIIAGWMELHVSYAAWNVWWKHHKGVNWNSDASEMNVL